MALSLVLNAALPYWIVKFDLSRSAELARSRAWPDVSFVAAVFVFGPLSLPVHFTKTRRSVLGFCLGFALCVASFLAEGLAASALGALLGVGP